MAELNLMYGVEHLPNGKFAGCIKDKTTDKWIWAGDIHKKHSIAEHELQKAESLVKYICDSLGYKIKEVNNG